jgi:hypothetical protein
MGRYKSLLVLTNLYVGSYAQAVAARLKPSPPKNIYKIAP